MANKSFEMVTVGDAREEDSLESQPERKSGSRLETKAVLEVRFCDNAALGIMSSFTFSDTSIRQQSSILDSPFKQHGKRRVYPSNSVC
jgi:hypothetical protein